MAIETKEITFEREIEYSLLDHGGYIKGDPHDYNREFAVDTKLLFHHFLSGLELLCNFSDNALRNTVSTVWRRIS